MKTIAFALCVAVLPLAEAAETCPKSMPHAVERRLEPLLRSLKVARTAQRAWDTRYEKQFEKLLSAKDPVAMEARVAAMSYYLGESHSTIIVCRVAQDGAAVLATLKRYSACAMLPAKEVLPRTEVPLLRERALKIIEEQSWNQSCVFE
jgi:hypothetical protein